MINLEQSENSHKANREKLDGLIASKTMILSLLILAFLLITFLVINKNIFIIDLDNAVKTFIGNHQYPFISDLMLSITKIGDACGVFIIFLIFGLFLILRRKKSFYIFAIASTFGTLLPQIIKPLAEIQRPANLFMENDYSFPSGHATIATVFLFCSIFLVAPFIKNKFSQKLFLLIASIIFPLVALSRIYLSVHWTTDVIASIILGGICFTFSQIVCCQKKENVL